MESVGLWCPLLCCFYNCAHWQKYLCLRIPVDDVTEANVICWRAFHNLPGSSNRAVFIYPHRSRLAFLRLLRPGRLNLHAHGVVIFCEGPG